MDVATVEMYGLGWFAAGREPILDSLADVLTGLDGVVGARIWARAPDRQVSKGIAGAYRDPDDDAGGPPLIRAPIDPDATGTAIGGVEATIGDGARPAEIQLMVDRIATHIASLIQRWRRDLANHGFAVVDTEARLLWANDVLGGILGWSLEETVGSNVLTYLHPDELDEAALWFERAATFPGPKVPYDLRYRTRDGGWQALETVADNRVDDPAVGGIIFRFRDPRDRTVEDRLVTTESEVLTAIAKDVPFAKVFDLVVAMLEARLPPTHWSVWAPDDVDPRLLVRIAVSGEDNSADDPHRIPLRAHGSVVGACFLRSQSVLVPDVTQEPLLDDDGRARLAAEGVKSVWAVPVLHADAMAGAVLACSFGTVGLPGADEARVLALAANLLALALERDRSRQASDHAATHDAMTGLANRPAFTDLLDSMVAAVEPGRLAVLFIDLDAFKTINDSLGHAAGDKLLCAVAERIQGCCDTRTDVVGLARFGGDEFMLLVENPSAATRLADEILDALAAPFEVDGYDLHVGASIGMAVHDPDLSPTASGLLSNADAAMSVAKRTRPKRMVAFDQDIAALVSNRLTTTTGLRRAIESEEFVVHYQTVVDLSSGRPVAAEALVRWHQGDVVHPPAIFLEVAEDTGLIVPIGRLVLGHAARRAARRSQTTFVNLSAHQLLDAGLLGLIETALEQAGAAADQIGFEITEHAVIPDPEAAIAVLDRLRDRGHPLSIDDFGTGYASLAYLRDLPVHSVKIDRSFTARMHADERTRTILAATIELAHDLDLTVVAEGIETEADAAAMAELGCDHGQGWHFHRPEPDI